MYCRILCLLFALTQITSASHVYDYADTTEPINPLIRTDTLKIQDYEFDLHSEDPYWEPSSKEEELRMELQRIGIVEYRPENLKYELLVYPDGNNVWQWYIFAQQDM